MRRDPVEEAEAFERHLAELAALPPKQKRAYYRATFRRETDYAERHAKMSSQIEEGRAFAAEAERDEN